MPRLTAAPDRSLRPIVSQIRTPLQLDATGRRLQTDGFVMPAKSTAKADTRATLKAFAVELILYAFLVTGYFFLVLHYLSGWLQDLHLHHVTLYATVAIALIIGQAVLLESVTTWLLRFLRGRSE
jgi:hypothetical protein